MLQKILMCAIVLALNYFAVAQTNKIEEIKADSLNSATTVAEEPQPKTVISGSVDVYYKYDFNKQAGNNSTSFTNSHNSFELGAARVKIEHTANKLDMVAELAFGKRAEEFSYNDAGTRAAIRQLYVSYSPWKDIKFTAGDWATHFDNEIFEPDANRNYSMSYMFTWGPFFHTGLKADATFGKHGFMLGVANPNDYKSFNNASKYVIAQYSLAATEKFKAYINYFAGKRPTDTAKVSQLEAILTQKFSDKFNMLYIGSIAFNKYKQGTKYGTSQNWWCSGLYFNYDPTSLFGLTLRTEYFNDEKQQNVFVSNLSGGGNIFETTLSANFRIDNLVIIPEIRFENASKEIFAKSSGSGTKSNGNFLIAAVYHF
ncbi:MAG TPA: outer membrane beta-barrel protein [Chitinophagaceae bacterium]|nr:outer membrane beta-barrel protein [Chitinophagaceae bacterium]